MKELGALLSLLTIVVSWAILAEEFEAHAAIAGCFHDLGIWSNKTFYQQKVQKTEKTNNDEK